MKFFCVLNVFFILFVHFAYAQTNDFFNDYQSFKKKSYEKYTNFRDEVNLQYATFIKDSWAIFQSFPCIDLPKEEKIPPVVIPNNDSIIIQDNRILINDTITIPKKMTQPKPINPIKFIPNDSKLFKFNYYGAECGISLPKGDVLYLENISNDELSKLWGQLSRPIYNNTIRDCLLIREELQLSDWSYLQMLIRFSQKKWGKTNLAVFVAAYIYCQSGYKMRLARNLNNLYLLYASDYIIYNRRYYVIDETYFYIDNEEVEQLDICKISYPNERTLSLSIIRSHNFPVITSNERILKSKLYPECQIKISTNQNLINFYQTYPVSEFNKNFMTRWAIYANTPLDEYTRSQVITSLIDILGQKNQFEKVSILLNFVQTAFDYEYDDKVWGYDRAFFSEESLFYPYCDCEDRSILFSRLVRDILGLDIILVYYPGHLATAVCFADNNVKGDYILFNNKRFIICDPTYIGAPIGITMPNMDNTKATIILLSSNK